MKRLTVLFLVLVLMIGGCCSYTATDGTVTKSFANCFKKAHDVACNPPADVMAIANQALPLIAMALSALVPGSAAYVALLANEGTATAIQSGICVSLTQLNNLIAFLQSPQAQVSQAKLAAEKKATPKALNIQPLLAWQAKFKK